MIKSGRVIIPLPLPTGRSVLRHCTVRITREIINHPVVDVPGQHVIWLKAFPL